MGYLRELYHGEIINKIRNWNMKFAYSIYFIAWGDGGDLGRGEAGRGEGGGGGICLNETL